MRDRLTPMDYRVFQHAVAEKSPLYRAVMRAFVEAKARYQVHLRPEDVRTAIGRSLEEPPDEDGLHQALAQLVAWGNLAAEADVSRVVSLEEFYRARYLYQLTREGEAAETALAAYDEALGKRGALQSVALEDIRLRLQSLEDLLEAEHPDPGVAHQVLRDLAERSGELADNAQAFMAGLGRSLEVKRAEREAFVAYKDRLIEYLERFIGDLTTASADIETRLRRIDAHPGLERVLGAVAEREAADELEPAEDDRAAIVARVAARWRGRWEGLRDWFVATGDQPAQAELLRARARHAIPEVLDMARRLNEQRVGLSDRANDFRTLARWFLEADDDGEAHRLWRGAFGLSPARHLAIDRDTLERRAADPVPASTPWPEAPPMAISPRLRATGHYRGKGPPPKMTRRDHERARVAERLAAEHEQARAARDRLATGEWWRLSEAEELERPAFDLLLALLAEALPRQRGDEPVAVTTRDGALRVELEPLAPGTRAAVPTADGVFRGRDHFVRITGTDEELTPVGDADGARGREAP